VRLLIIEDNVDLYNDYFIRLFANLLPMDQIEVVHAASLEDGVREMAKTFDVILVDYSLGASYTKEAEAEGEEARIFRDGSELVAYRREMEGVVDGLTPAFIMGTSNNHVGNSLIEERGANTSYLKLHVVEIAEEIGKKLQ